MAPSLMKFVQSSFRRIVHTREDSPSASPSSTPMTRRTRGPFTTGVPFNPEAGGVGLLAAVAEPASSHLRVAIKPVRTGGIRGIMAVSTDHCCNGTCGTVYCGGGGSGTEATTSRIISCRLCSRRLDGRRVYMRMGLPFCTRRCRFIYFMAAR